MRATGRGSRLLLLSSSSMALAEGRPEGLFAGPSFGALRRARGFGRGTGGCDWTDESRARWAPRDHRELAWRRRVADGSAQAGATAWVGRVVKEPRSRCARRARQARTRSVTRSVRTVSAQRAFCRAILSSSDAWVTCCIVSRASRICLDFGSVAAGRLSGTMTSVLCFRPMGRLGNRLASGCRRSGAVVVDRRSAPKPNPARCARRATNLGASGRPRRLHRGVSFARARRRGAFG